MPTSSISDSTSERRIEAIAAGDELLGGVQADTNSVLLQQHLMRAGLTLSRSTIIGDDLRELADAFRDAFDRTQVLIISGGLGGTHDDLTREALAEAAGVSLAFNDDARDLVACHLERRGRAFDSSYEVLARLPQSARPLQNPFGLAPGVEMKVGDCQVFALPGVPAEFEGMIEKVVLPRLEFEGGGEIVQRTIKLVGLTESEVQRRAEKLLGDFRDGTRPFGVGITVNATKVSLRLRGPSTSKPSILEAIAHLESEFGDALFGYDDDTLEDVVGGLLIHTNTTIAVAESCTGGKLCERLIGVPGISTVLIEGCVTYSNEAKQRTLDVSAAVLREHGAVSVPVAEAMATGVAARAGTDLGVGITGVAGPGGGTEEKPVGLIYVALFDRGHIQVRELRTAGSRTSNQEYAVTAALNLIRMSRWGQRPGLGP